MLDQNNLHNVYLALGSNLGDKEVNIQQAIVQIEERIGAIVSLSALYTTLPMGFESDNQFLNAACHLRSRLHPLEILQITQIIELELGRKTKSLAGNYTDRIIDIDILLFDNECLAYPHLILPHPEMHNRLFVMQPLAEIAPHLVHPSLSKTMDELYHQLLIEKID